MCKEGRLGKEKPSLHQQEITPGHAFILDFQPPQSDFQPHKVTLSSHKMTSLHNCEEKLLFKSQSVCLLLTPQQINTLNAFKPKTFPQEKENPIISTLSPRYQVFIIHFLKQQKVEGIKWKFGLLISITKKKTCSPRQLLQIHLSNALLSLLFVNPQCAHS